MRINSVQAGQILGCSAATVRGLCAAGRLHDLATNGSGKMKHCVLLAASEVRQLAKTYTPRRRTFGGTKPRDTGGLITPGRLAVRLDELDAKLDRLLALWS